MSDVSAEVVELAADLIRFDTSNFGQGEARPERECAEYIFGKLQEVGISPQIYESEPGRATLVADWPGADDSVPPLLIHGHTDVVPAIASDWKVDPFAGEIVDGQIWGRGAVDMKDFDAMVLAVLRSRMIEGRAPRRPIRLVFTADEENGGALGSRWLVQNHPELVADCSDAIGEVGGFSLTVRDDLRLYLVQTAEKGIAWLKLIAEGQAGHGSLRNDSNAVTELAKAVSRIGAHQWPKRITPAQQQFLDAVEDALGVPVNLDNAEESLARLGSISRLIGAALQNTANPTQLDAGYKVNVIPGEASACIDGRFIPGCREELLETVQVLLGDKVRYEFLNDDIAVETEFAGALVEAMQASISAEDPQSKTVPYLTSVGTDAKAWSTLGIRCFGFAPLQLPPDLDFVSLFHGVDERVPIESLRFGCRVLDRFLDLA
ncbi:MAG: M20/M25/M40 family metallo-hydrolase [Propionibacteriaceae bacterium]|jgi:acetylornithine deacetylase/succinyl-diaminopimelate desuccinylase-like protein|nr:M20/M25/M40 family metallo-hydrolase [Propionibacteriaceae bacterium]